MVDQKDRGIFPEQNINRADDTAGRVSRESQLSSRVVTVVHNGASANRLRFSLPTLSHYVGIEQSSDGFHTTAIVRH